MNRLIRYLFLSLSLLLTFNSSAQFIINPYAVSPNNTTADGKRVFLWIGDSIIEGSDNSSGPGPSVPAGVAYQWNATSNTVTALTSGDVYNVVSGGGTAMPQFCITYNSVFTDKHPVVMPCGSSGSNFAYDGDTNNWGPTGTLRAATETKVTNCLNSLGLNQLYGIVVGLGINDAKALEATEPLDSALAGVDKFFLWLTTKYPGVPILTTLFGKQPAANLDDRIHAIRWKILENCRLYNNVCVPFTQASWIGVSGAYGADNLHPTIAGQNYMGDSVGRWWWTSNQSYSKWARSIISSLYEDITTPRKVLIDNFITTIGNDYFLLDNLIVGKTSTLNNIFVDWSFMGFFTQTGGTFTANNSFATTGVSNYWSTGFLQSVNVKRMTSSDNFMVTKIKTNSTAAGTLGYNFGAIGGGAYANSQTTTPNLNWRDNDATLSSYATDTKFTDNTVYGIARNSGTKYLLKGTTSAANASVALTSACTRFVRIGVLDNGGTLQNPLNCSYEYYVAGKYSTINYATLITALETVVNNW